LKDEITKMIEDKGFSKEMATLIDKLNGLKTSIDE
jgi:hypothetical protein